VKAKVLIAQDKPLLREGLELILGQYDEIEVVGSASDGEAALRLAGELQPDVVVIDLLLPGLDGVEVTQRITMARPRTQVLVLAAFADEESALAAIDAGAAGYLTPETDGEHLRRAIRTLLEGGAVLDSRVQRRLLERVRAGARRSDAPASELTQRELEVLRLIAAGFSNHEIAERLHLSEATVKSHVNSLLAKTGLRDRAQAVAYAYRHGLADEAN
jgi:DNA-binding NarL/FixJ family response regulator